NLPVPSFDQYELPLQKLTFPHPSVESRRFVQRQGRAEKSPDATPAIDLLRSVLRQPAPWQNAAVEEVTARRIVVHHRLGQPGLAGPQRIDQRHALLDIHVTVVRGDPLADGNSH